MKAFIYFAITLALTPLAFSQTGTLDQSSPRSNSWYNEDASFLIWQQEIQAGISGKLEGIMLTISSPEPGASFFVRVRLGAAPSTQTILFEQLIVGTVVGNEQVFVDTLAAGIVLSAGDAFVMETQGTDTRCGLIGNYVDPAAGPPLYPLPLYLNGSIFFPGWRHGFDTYIIESEDCDPCDVNCNGTVNQFDIIPFVEVIVSHIGCSPCAGDADGNGTANTFDINGFIDCLTP